MIDEFRKPLKASEIRPTLTHENAHEQEHEHSYNKKGNLIKQQNIQFI